MEYITEIKAFYNLTVDNPLSTGQIALWHALMYINNKCHWTKNFTVSNATLQLYTGLSRWGINDARNVLKQRGLIDFTAGNRGQSTTYEIKTLSNIPHNSREVSHTTPTEQATQLPPSEPHNSPPLKRERKRQRQEYKPLNPL